MKRRILSVLLALLAAVNCGTLSTCAARGPAYTSADFENGQVLVGYADGSFELLAFDGEAALVQGLAQLERDEQVTLVQPNYTYENTALALSDELAGLQWALSNDGSFQMEEEDERLPIRQNPFVPDRWNMRPFAGEYRTAGQTVTAQAGIDINVEEAWSVYKGGSREVIIALIDTGVDYTHEELADAIWINEDEIDGNGVDDDGNGYVDDVHGWNFYNNSSRVYVRSSDDGHGTHGAGTIAAAADNETGIAGIVNSENVKIMVLKALGGSDGSGTTASIIQAIQYAQANGASICNLSLGNSTNDPALYRVMANSPMLFVAAAGNDGAETDQAPCYPASYDLDNIISVANLNCDGTLHESSNYGATSVDLAAPGTYILSTTPEGGYSYMSGTSMAAPMVTAAAAMLYSHYDGITLADVKDLLLSTVQPLDSLSGSTVTGGMLDLGAAMTGGISGLTGRQWDNASASDGSAPEIAVRMFSWQGKTYLTVQVTDADHDLELTAYAAGEQTAQAFSGGANGTTFELDSSGTATFSASGSGVYTFYALDGQGNETVQTVSITVEAPVHEPGRFAPPGRQSMGARRFGR